MLDLCTVVLFSPHELKCNIHFMPRVPKLSQPVGTLGFLKGSGRHCSKMAAGGRPRPQMGAAEDGVKLSSHFAKGE